MPVPVTRASGQVSWFAPPLRCWAAAAAVAVAVAFFAPLPLVPRAIAALCVGPVCGFAVHLAAMMVHARSVQALSEGEALREMLVENTVRGETH